MSKKVERMLTLLLINSKMFQNSQNGSTLTSNPHTNTQTLHPRTQREKKKEKKTTKQSTQVKKLKKKQNVMHFYFHTT